MSEAQDVRLVVEIKNKEPLELVDLTRSFLSIASQFSTYAAEYGDSKENREAKLYVKEIKSGSVIMELVEYATVGVLPFVENINTIVGFAGYIRDTYNHFLGKNDKPKNFTPSDLKDFKQIVNPVANDAASQLNLMPTINGNPTFNITINSTEANAVQNVIEKESMLLKSPEIANDIHTKVLLKWFQTRSDINAKVGNKANIDELSDKPMNVTFEDESIREVMLHGDINPLTTAYVVDVKLQTIQGKLAAYKIVKLHEHFEIE